MNWIHIVMKILTELTKYQLILKKVFTKDRVLLIGFVIHKKNH